MAQCSVFMSASRRKAFSKAFLVLAFMPKALKQQCTELLFLVFGLYRMTLVLKARSELLKRPISLRETWTPKLTACFNEGTTHYIWAFVFVFSERHCQGLPHFQSTQHLVVFKGLVFFIGIERVVNCVAKKIKIFLVSSSCQKVNAIF